MPPPPHAPAANPVRAALAALGEGLKARDFWLLAATFFVCGASTNGYIGTHFIAFCYDGGMPELQAASILATMGLFNLVGTSFSGWLTDRYDSRKLLFVYYLFRGVSLLTLPAIHDSLGIVAFAVLFGIDYIATVPPTIALTADTFGGRNVGVVYGWIFASHMVGAAIAAWGAGVIRDDIGTYAPAFIGAAMLAGLASLAALMIRRPVIRAA